MLAVRNVRVERRVDRHQNVSVNYEHNELVRSRSFLQENKNIDVDAQDLKPVLASVDIVLVPALVADFDLTWNTGVPRRVVQRNAAGFRQRADNVETIFSSLPNGVSARVLQYDYRESLQKDSLTDMARDLLDAVMFKRSTSSQQAGLLHFAAHSTGGLVVKKALLIAQQSPEYRPIFTSCFGVSFFGVPHRGSTILSDDVYAHGVQQELKLAKSLSRDVREMLKPENRVIARLNEDFKTKSRRFRRIWTFIEAEEALIEVHHRNAPIRGSTVGSTRTYIVDRRSSELGVGNETVLEVDAKHGHLCKFTGRLNISCLTRYKNELSSIIQEMTRSDMQLHQSLPIEVHLFYQDETRPEYPKTSARVKLLTAKSKFNKLIDEGPRACLEERLSHNNPQYQVSTAPEESVSEAHFEGPQIQIFEPEDYTLSPTVSNEPAASDGLMTPPEITDKFTPSVLQRQGTATSVSTSVQSLDDPALSTKHFSWIHVPCNHPSFALDVLDCITAEKMDFNPSERLLNEYLLRSNHNLSHYGLPHSRRMRSQFKILGAEPNMRLGGRKLDPPSMVIYLPYLHWDTLDSMKMRNLLTRFKHIRDPKKRSSKLAQLKSVEHQLLWENPDGHGNLHIHQRRSLDQFGYPSLKDTTARDHDQVLYKRTKSLRGTPLDGTVVAEASAIDPLVMGDEKRMSDMLQKGLSRTRGDSGKVLMVDQLWLFATDKDHVVTFFTPKETEEGENATRNIGDLRNSIYNDVNGDPMFATQCHSTLEFAALAVLHAVTVILSRVSDPELQVFDIFESYIGHLAEAQTQSFKNFRKNQESRALRLDDPSVEGVLNEAEQERCDRADLIQDLQNLTELHDIEDELSTISKLLDEQHEVVSAMNRHANSFRLSPNHEDVTAMLLKETAEHINQYQKQVKKLKEQCQVAHNAYKFLLDMRDRQSSILQGKRTFKSAATAEDQNRSIIVFTIFTIIFLPISFFTSLFGVNAKEWSGNDANPALHKIFVLTFSISAAVIVVALILAFNRISRKYFFLIFARPYRFMADRIEGATPVKRKYRIGNALKPMFSPEEGYFWKLEPARIPVASESSSREEKEVEMRNHVGP